MASALQNFIKKEVLCDCLVNDGWKEITFNSSGTPSIQDIKIPPRTGGLNISNHSNRFIYWKTRGNILELVEHSLDVNIAGNQLRYKFEDSPVLGDSVSLYETKQNIVLLVATISSVHKIQFPRPKVISTRHEHVNSIFSDSSGAAESINNGACYHIINTASTLPYTGASYLTSEGEAVFGLALQSGSVTLIKINPNGEKHAKVFDVKSDSFFGGLNFFSKAARSSAAQDASLLGLVFKCVSRTLYLVTLSYDGQLKCWNAEMQLVAACDALAQCSTRNPGIQSHILRKASDEADPTVWLFLCLEADRSCFVQLCVSPRGQLELRHRVTSLPHLISPHLDQLLDFLVLRGRVWCMWHTLENESLVTGYDQDGGEDRGWHYAQLESLQIHPSSPALCPQGKISDLIFKPGLFSASDVTRALEIQHNGHALLADPHLTLRQKVLQAVEREIDAKVSELPDSLDDSARAASEHYLSEQTWEDFYSACLQYRKLSLPPLGMHHIGPANLLLLIKKNSLSFLRPLDELEELVHNPGSSVHNQSVHNTSKSVHNTSKSVHNSSAASSEDLGSGSPRKESYAEFDQFMAALSALHLDNNSNQEIAFTLTDAKKDRGSNEDLPSLSGSKQFRQLLNEFAQKPILDLFEDRSELTQLREMKESELTRYIEQFLSVLNRSPVTDVTPGSQYYTSLLGVNLLSMSLNQVAELRLRLACNLVIVLRTREGSLFDRYYESLWQQIRDAWILTWLQNNVDPRSQDSVLLGFVASTDLRHPQLMATAHLLASHPHTSIVQHLAQSPDLAPFLQDLARLLDYSGWKYELMGSYLSSGQDKQAFAIVKEFSRQANLDYFIQVIDIFSKFLSCEYVIEIIHVALDTLGQSSNTRECSVLYSILFDNQLRLRDYGRALDTILANQDTSKAHTNLHVLILSMMEAGEARLLLELLTPEEASNTCRIVPEVIDFCHKRMYTFPIDQSEVYFEFLFSYHVHNAYHSEAAQVKFNQAFCYAKDLSKRCECLAAALSLMHLIDEPCRRYVNRKKDPERLSFKMYKGEKIYTELAFDQLSLSEVKKIYELEKAKAYVKDCPLDASLEEVVCLLTHNGLYKKALQLATLWRADLRPVFVSLTARCLQDDAQEWAWVFLNDIGDYASPAQLDIGALMWALLEALLDTFEPPGHKEVLRSVSEKIISQGYDLPQFLKRKYFSLCPGEVVQLMHKHGALQAATDLSCDILHALTSGKSGEEDRQFPFCQLRAESSPVYCGLQHVRHLQAELARQEDEQAAFTRLKHTLGQYEEHAAKVTAEKFALLSK